MQRDRRIRKSQDFFRVSTDGRSWADHRLVLRAAPNESSTTRYGFVVRKSIGSAVARNRLKRRLRARVRHPGGVAGGKVSPLDAPVLVL